MGDATKEKEAADLKGKMGSWRQESKELSTMGVNKRMKELPRLTLANNLASPPALILPTHSFPA